MENLEPIHISKGTQKFIADLADLPPDKYNKVRNLLLSIQEQQAVEAQLEKQRGWRYMWQRTPKPYLLMLGYLVFLAPVGGAGLYALSYINIELQLIYIIILALIMLSPLTVVFYLSYNYVKHKIADEEVKEVPQVL